MEERHMLVQRGQLDQVIADLVEKQRTVITDLDKVLPVLQDVDLKRKLTLQKRQAEMQLEVLEKGYIPVEGGWFWDINTKNKWAKGAVKEVIASMPEEVTEAMHRAVDSGDFDKIKVNGARRGDPMLVGTKGKVNYILAMWCNFVGGYSVGFVFRPQKSRV
jgi:D-alanine-D-alanine ligase-like ATP-grasp enzyme